jgi:hypothetical protein
VECILVDDGLRNGGEGNSHFFFAHHGCFEIIFFKIEGGKAGAGVEMTLFRSNFTVDRSAVGVLTLSG